MTKKYHIIKDGYVISKHKTLALANQKLKRIDTVKYSLYSTDLDWIKYNEEANMGYNHIITYCNCGQ